MKLKPFLLAIAAVAPLSGCTVGLPRGPIEPSITADCVAYLNENWLGPLQGGSAHYDAEAAPPPHSLGQARQAQPQQGPSRPTQAAGRQARQVAATSAAEELAPPAPTPRPVAAASPMVEDDVVPAGCEHGPSCHDCPLIPNACLPNAVAQPMYVDPGPPGRFLPVPVRPVFAPRPEMGYLQPMPPAY